MDMPMTRHSPQLFVASCELFVLLFSASACTHKAVEEVETQAPVPVQVTAAKVQALQSTINAAGIVATAPGAELTVVAPAPARIAEIPKAEGESVRTGDLLVRFDIPSLASDVATKKAAVSQASARLEQDKSTLARLTSLVSQGVAAPREVEDAKRQLAEAEADLEQAKSAVDASVALSGRADVRATFSGVVSKRFHNPGDLVDASASDPVLKIVDPSRIQVVASVPVADLPRIEIGHTAQIVSPGSDAGEPAKVLTRPSQVDPASETTAVRLAFTKPTRLAVGTAVQVQIMAEQHPNALVIPAGAIVRDEGETFVMVAGADNKAHKYPITLGLVTHDLVEVMSGSGINAGDKVIVRGQEELPEGATIAIQ